MVAPASGVSGSSSTSTSGNDAAAAAAAAEAARRRAEEARRAAEAARKAAEAAAKAAAEAAKAAAAAKKAAEDAKKQAADKTKSPEEQKKAGDASKVAEKKAADAAKAAEQKALALQKAEENVAISAKKAATEMTKANEIAKREKVAQPFTEKDIKATEPKKNELASAFEGTRRKADLEKLLGTQAPSAAETQQRINAEQQFEILNSKPENKATLEQLGIKNPQDLISLGDRLEGQAKSGEGPRANDVDFKGVQDKDALGRIISAAGDTRTDEAMKKTMKDPLFASQLKEGKSPKEAKEAVEIKDALKLTEREFVNVFRTDSARGAARTLVDPNSTPDKRLSAALALGSSINQALPPEKVKEVLGNIGERIPGNDVLNRTNAQLGNAKAMVDAYTALFNPNASPAAQAKAGVAVANAAKNLLGAEGPQALKDLQPALRKLDGPARMAGAGLTLLDPNAKPEDQAIAALQLAGEAPGAWRDSKAFLQTLRDARVPNPEALVKDAQSLANRTLGDLPDELKNKLTANQVSELGRAGSQVDIKDITPLLQKLDASNAGGLDNVLRQVNNAASPEEAKRFLGAVSGLDPKIMAEALKDGGTTEKLFNLSKKMPVDGTTDHLGDMLKKVKSGGDLEKVLGKLDGLDGPEANKMAKALKGLDAGELGKLINEPDALDNLGKTLKHLDGQDLDTFVKLTSNMDAGGISKLAKFAGQTDGSTIKDVLKVAGPLLEHMDGRTLGKLGEALGKGLDMMSGLLTRMGVAVTGEVAGKVLKNLSKIVPGLGALPGLYDAAKLTKEGMDLKDQNKDLSFLAFTGAKLNALDAVGGLILDATGVGVGVDLAAGAVLGVAELALDIGLHSEKAKMVEAQQKGESYEAPDWVKAVNLAGAVAGGPVGIGHMIAHYGPKESFEMAKWGLEQGGKIAEKAWDVMKEVGGKFVEYAGEAVEALKNLGEAGVEKLEDLAKGAGEFAEAAAAEAQEALKDMAKATGEAARKAAEAISRGVDAGAEWAKDAATELLKDGAEAMKDVAKAWADGMTDGAKAVVDGLENLGEEGVEALKDLSSAGGDVAEYTVDKLKNLADAGIDAAKDALGKLEDLGGAVGDLAKGALGKLGGLVSALPGL
ncbi:hypothetical protein [Pyxidicoccus xibeiensis]|uniref:hypothetical protein n=1 Tax=Pyxidicoccus xibeiensis TaxID=2906759 RepID=UPI0020A76FD5|nr:hypothetical protein [Pyxidicoccus xibeiensis]MCP3140130.1 hypothetical protein [Pyxidicoccus xibeiensis]